jgi:hypothetical protein
MFPMRACEHRVQVKEPRGGGTAVGGAALIGAPNRRRGPAVGGSGHGGYHSEARVVVGALE